MLGTKYTGLGFILAFAVAAAVGTKSAGLRLRARPFGAWLALATALFLVSSGHYYVKNLVRFQNPVYPVTVAFAEFVVHLDRAWFQTFRSAGPVVLSIRGPPGRLADSA